MQNLTSAVVVGTRPGADQGSPHCSMERGTGPTRPHSPWRKYWQLVATRRGESVFFTGMTCRKMLMLRLMTLLRSRIQLRRSRRRNEVGGGGLERSRRHQSRAAGNGYNLNTLYQCMKLTRN